MSWRTRHSLAGDRTDCGGSWPTTGTCSSRPAARRRGPRRPARRSWPAAPGRRTHRGIPSATPRASTDGRPRRPGLPRGLSGAAFNRMPTCRRCAPSSGGSWPEAFSYPAKVLRAVYPSPAARRWAATSARRLRGLRRPGHADQLGPAHGHPGPGRGPGRAARRAPRPPRARRARSQRPSAAGRPPAYQPGDVIIFHCLTPHAALPNTSPALRLSGDFRWQRPDQPAPRSSSWARPAAGAAQPAAPPGAVVGAGPGRPHLVPRRQLAAAPPGPSRFFAVHPGWRHWRPPPAAVH